MYIIWYVKALSCQNGRMDEGWKVLLEPIVCYLVTFKDQLLLNWSYFYTMEICYSTPLVVIFTQPLFVVCFCDSILNSGTKCNIASSALNNNNKQNKSSENLFLPGKFFYFKKKKGNLGSLSGCIIRTCKDIFSPKETSSISFNANQWSLRQWRFELWRRQNTDWSVCDILHVNFLG